MLLALLLLAQATPRGQVHIGADGNAVMSANGASVSLESPAFYKMVGREDLAIEYDQRSFRRTLLQVFGGAVIAGGLMTVGVGAVGPQLCSAGPNLASCQSNSRTAIYVGAAIAAAGIATLVGATLMDPNPVPVEERRRLAEKFNERVSISLAPARAGGTIAAALTF